MVRWLCSVLVIVSGLLLPTGAAAFPTSGGSVTLEPASGRPGSNYTATVTPPDNALCAVTALTFDGERQWFASSVELTGAAFGVGSSVPDTAQIGSSTVVVSLSCTWACPSDASCPSGGNVTLRAIFDVTAPEVTVPDLTGKTRDEAKDALGKDLVVGSVSGEGTVVDQSPEPGATVTPGTAVDLTLKTPASPSTPPQTRTVTQTVTPTEASTVTSTETSAESPSGSPSAVPFDPTAGSNGTGWLVVVVLVLAVMLASVAARLLRRGGRHVPGAVVVSVRPLPDRAPTAWVRERPGRGGERR